MAVDQVQAGIRQRRLKSGLHKLRWGAEDVGWPATVRGLGRLASLAARRPPTATVRLRSGFELEFAYPSQCVPALVVFGDVIDPEYRLLERIARPGWVAVDVGAAIGQFSVFAARLPCAAVHAFEPSGANVATLRANVRRNDVGSLVTVHQVALGGTDGDLAFATAATTYLSRPDRPDGTVVEVVPVRALGAELDRLGLIHVDVLKINVAGYEPDVLAGAADFLAAGRADVLILLLGAGSLTWYQKMLGWGYRLFFFHPGTGRLHEAAESGDALLHGVRPSPARHLIAVHSGAIARGVLSPVEILAPGP